MFRSLKLWLVLGLLVSPAFCLRAQDHLIAGFGFSQFLGEGYPAISGSDFAPVSSIDATYSGTTLPDLNLIDGVYVGNNGIEGYVSGIATWSFANFDISNAVDVRADTFGALNFANSTTVHTPQVIGVDLALGDTAGMMLTFQVPGVRWDITLSTLGYSATATAPNLSFAARAPAAAVVVDWYLDGAAAPFASTPVAAGSAFNTYVVDLPPAFYGKASVALQGSLRSAGVVSFDNVQINGSLARSPLFDVQPEDKTVTVGSTVEFSVVVSGAASPTYRWKRDGVALSDQDCISGATTATLVLSGVQLSQSGLYSVEVNNNGVLAESEGAILLVQSGPAITRQPAAASANPGQTVEFEIEADASPAPAFRWQRDGEDLFDGPGVSGAATATLTLTGVTVASAGEYRVVVSNAAGTATSDVALLTVTELAVAPTVSTPPAPATVTAGGAAEFLVVATGAPAPSYAWYFGDVPLADGGDISGSSGPRLRIANVTPARAGLYRVRVSNSAGSVEREAALVVRVAPSIQSGPGPASRSVLVGAAVAFEVVASGDPAPGYQWLRDDEPIPGATQPRLVLDPASERDSGDYRVRVTNAAGSVLSAVSALVVGAPPAIVTQPVARTAVAGANIEFGVVASGSPAPTYQWFKGDDEIEGADEPSYVVQSASAEDVGAYSVRVTNALGVVTSAPAELRLTQAVRLNASSAVQVFAPGGVLSLGVDQDVGSLRYQWFLNGRAISGANQPFLVIEDARFADSGTYSVKVYNSAGRLLATKVVAKIKISVAGAYEALVRDASSNEPIGRAQLTFDAVGSFTGQLRYEDGKNYSLKGRLVFDENGYEASFEGAIKRKSPLTTLSYSVGFNAQAKELEFELADGEFVLGSALGEPRLASGATAAWAGAYDLALAPLPTDLPDQPTATAILKSTIAKKGGAMKLTGKLADGASITASVPSSTGGVYATWLHLYFGKGRIAGDLRLVSVSESSYAADLASSGEWIWFRAPDAKSAVFPGGIDLLLAPELARR